MLTGWQRALMRLAIVATVLGVALVVAPAAGGASPAPAAPAAPARASWPAVPVAPRTLTALPGFRRTASGPVLDVQRFTTVAAVALPSGRPAGHRAVLGVTLRVDTPTRIALSVRAWCVAGRAPGAAPDATSLHDVLVIEQNPVPGRAPLQVASRTLTGRAVVDVPATGAVRCVAQVSPRTESLVGSRLRLLGGTFTARPAAVPVRGAQRPAVLVGTPRGPAVREVAVSGLATAEGAVRAEGEAELTTCALGYHLCGRGSAPTSVVDVALRLDDVAADGRVCRAWRGSSRRVTITPAVHHVKVAAPSLRLAARCGVRVRAALRVAHVSGNPVEVEPTLGLPGEARRVQTHTWIETS